MAYVAGFICLLLVAFCPDRCRAQFILTGQVYRLSAEIDKMVETAHEDAKTYATELQELFDNLNTNASADLSSLNSTVNELVTSVQLYIANDVADADDTDVSECTDLATPLISSATEIQGNAESCIGREVEQAGREVEMTLAYVDLQLNTLASFQTFARNCIVRFNESEQTSSDAQQAFACVQPLHRSTQLFMLRFDFVIDIEVAKDLFNGYETRVAACTRTSTGDLQSLTSTVQDVYDDISTCVAEAIDSTS